MSADPLPTHPPPCPMCGAVIETTAYMPRGQWDYVQLPDGRAALQLIEPLDPLIIPFLKGVPVAHVCDGADLARLRAEGVALVSEAEAFLRSQ